MSILSVVFSGFVYLLGLIFYLPLLLIKPLANRVLHQFTVSIFENKIVFNCAWEDPAIDKKALDLEEDKDVICIITSAGCNVLSLAIDSPKHIYTIDRNPCQNAVLELKIAAIRELDYDTFWEMFGKGKLKNFSTLWYPRLRQHLSIDARKFWDKHSHYFDGTNRFGRNSYYYRGSAGMLAWIITKMFFRLVPGLTQAMNDLIHAENLEQQRQIYKDKVEKRLWNPIVMWLFSSSSTLALLNGVPAAQQKLLAEQAGAASVGHFIKQSLETVLVSLPVKNNYFYRVYLENGEYSKDCCPDYLIEENFLKLKNGLVDRISIHTETVEEFLIKHKDKKSGEPKQDITRYILLDHMDWMSENPAALSAEWQQILDHSSPSGVRYLWRSASATPDFVCATKVKVDDQETTVGKLIQLNTDLSERLHKLDRVHTYTSFWIADPK